MLNSATMQFSTRVAKDTCWEATTALTMGCVLPHGGLRVENFPVLVGNRAGGSGWRLTDVGKKLLEPRLCDVEGFATLDP